MVAELGVLVAVQHFEKGGRGSPRMSLQSLSTSSSSITGFIEPACFIAVMNLPGIAPI